MKFLIALLFVAAASAATHDVQPIQLPEGPMPFEMPDIRPLFVPEHVLREVKLAEEAKLSMNSMNSEDGMIVQVVDVVPSSEAKFMDEVQEDSEQYTVKVIDSLLELNEDPEQPYLVNIVDSPLEVQHQEAPVESVRVADIVPPRYPSKVFPDPTWR